MLVFANQASYDYSTSRSHRMCVVMTSKFVLVVTLTFNVRDICSEMFDYDFEMQHVHLNLDSMHDTATNII